MIIRFVKIVHIKPEDTQTKGYSKVAWHPTNSNIFATAGMDGNVIVWDLEQLQQLGTEITRPKDFNELKGGAVLALDSEV